MKIAVLTFLSVLSFSSFSAETYEGINEKGETCAVVLEVTEAGDNKITILNHKESLNSYNDNNKLWKPRDLTLTTDVNNGDTKVKRSSVQRYDFGRRERTNNDEIVMNLSNGKPVSYKITSKIKIKSFVTMTQATDNPLKDSWDRVKFWYQIPEYENFTRSSKCTF